MPPRSLAYLKRELSEAKWTGARRWIKAQLVRTKNSNKGQRQAEAGPDCGSSQQEARIEVSPAEDGTLSHRPVPPVDDGKARRQCWWSQYPRTSPRTARSGRASRRLSGLPSWKRPESTVPETAELFAGERCSKAILDFLATMDVGKTAGPPVAVAEEEAGIEVSAWRTVNARST